MRIPLVGQLELQYRLNPDLGEPTHTLVPCWMPKPLPTRNQCMGSFTPALNPSVHLFTYVDCCRIITIRNIDLLQIILSLLKMWNTAKHASLELHSGISFFKS